MTTFGWKRKAGQNISKDLIAEFSGNTSDISDALSNVTWIQSFKRKKTSLQENCKIKCEEFKTAGIKLAESQRFKEAVTEWDKALNLAPDNYKILEMKAQALLQLNNAFLAVQVAEKAVRINPRWWVSYQTLGRCQLAIGDIYMAKKSFSKAIHIDPTVQELWEDDLKWTLQLIDKKISMELKDKSEVQVHQVTLDDEGYIA